jgi:hypothetical protein
MELIKLMGSLSSLRKNIKYSRAKTDNTSNVATLRLSHVSEDVLVQYVAHSR